jgi:hypothetical protein
MKKVVHIENRFSHIPGLNSYCGEHTNEVVEVHFYSLMNFIKQAHRNTHYDTCNTCVQKLIAVIKGVF